MHMMAWRIGRRLGQKCLGQKRVGPKHLGRILGKLRSTRSAVAMMYALMAPLMIASTGVAVDIGYWYQQQTNLQSAADAAALAAAQNAVAYGVLNNSDAQSFATGAGQSIAQAAANTATVNQYNFGSSASRAVSLSGSSTYASNATNAAETWTATVTAPRQDFFSHVSMPTLGLFGLGGGTQGATATVQAELSNISSGGSGACINISGNITAGGSASPLIDATNCGIYGGGTLLTSGGGNAVIEGATVSTGQSSQAAPAKQGDSGTGYIGTSACYTYGAPGCSSINNVTVGATAPTDVLKGMNSSDTLLWDATPTPPAGVTGTTTCKGACAPGNYTSMSGVSTINNSSTTGTTTDSGSFGAGSSLTVNGNYTYLASGATLDAVTTKAGTANVNCGKSGSNTLSTNLCFTVNSGGLAAAASVLGNTATFASGTYFINGTASTSSTKTANGLVPATGYGLTFGNSAGSTTTLGGGNWFVNGGLNYLGGAGPTFTMAPGLYDFEAYNNGPYAFNPGSGSSVGPTTLGSTTSGSCPTTTPPASATYYFYGNVALGLGSTKLCSGVYYIRNGTLTFVAGNGLTGTNITIILQGTASYNFSGSNSVTLTAPTTTTDPDCVEPDSYPEADYEDSSENSTSPPSGFTGMPYDGTNGHGICGVAIYQDRNDTTADNVGASGAVTITINGAVYTPNAALNFGSASGTHYSITTTNLPGLTAASLTTQSAASISVTENTTAGVGGPSGNGAAPGANGGTTIGNAVYLLTN